MQFGAICSGRLGDSRGKDFPPDGSIGGEAVEQSGFGMVSNVAKLTFFFYSSGSKKKTTSLAGTTLRRGCWSSDEG